MQRSEDSLQGFSFYHVGSETQTWSSALVVRVLIHCVSQIKAIQTHGLSILMMSLLLLDFQNATYIL